MCGIIGLISSKPVSQRLLEALKRLEYRGYDSSGIAVFEKTETQRVRAVGPVSALKEKMPSFQGTIGLGHTRWATHGGVDELNAHPHISQGIAVVHNGIIENFAELKTQLLAEGYEFESETDTEVIAHLLHRLSQKTQDLKSIFLQLLPLLEGAFSIACLFDAYPDRLIVARRGAGPLAIGYGEGEMAVSSDALGLVGIADRLCYLDDDNWAIVTETGADIFDAKGTLIHKELVSNPVLYLELERGTFEHYMLKEIHEQSAIIDRLNQQKEAFSLKALPSFQQATFLGCGTAYYAAWMGKLYWERFLGVPISLELASEFHYRTPPLLPGITIAVSQSGETADTLKAAEYAKGQGQTLVAVVNVPESSLARMADHVFYTQAGPEVSVASTKGFITQLWVLFMLACQESGLRQHADQLPVLMEQVFLLMPRIQEIARLLSSNDNILYLGRGLGYPLALEGALKMKELAYIHAEGMPSGELKHGPLALIDKKMGLILLAPYDEMFEKTMSNLHEITARGGRVITLTDAAGVQKMGGVPMYDTLVLPTTPPLLFPFVYTLAMQLLAYYTASYKGVSIDKPRHLAKCVTVE